MKTDVAITKCMVTFFMYNKYLYTMYIYILDQDKIEIDIDIEKYLTNPTESRLVYNFP